MASRPLALRRLPARREYRLRCLPQQVIGRIQAQAAGMLGFETRGNRFVLSTQGRSDRLGEAVVGLVEPDEQGTRLVIEPKVAYPTWTQGRSLVLLPLTFLAVYYGIGLLFGLETTVMFVVFYTFMVMAGGITWNRTRRRQRLVALLEAVERSIADARVLPDSSPFRPIAPARSED